MAMWFDEFKFSTPIPSSKRNQTWWIHFFYFQLGLNSIQVSCVFYRRELWTSKSAGANSTSSPKICGCKRWCPKDLRVLAPVLTHSLCYLIKPKHISIIQIMYFLFILGFIGKMIHLPKESNTNQQQLSIKQIF